MARMEDIPEPTRTVVRDLPIAPVATALVSGPPLERRRVALVSSAALFRRGEAPFAPGSGEFRALPADLAPGEILMSHVSINFDRSGWQRDLNTVYPVDRLRELVAAGEVGGMAATHYSVLGSTEPAALAASAAAIAQRMRAEGADTAVLCPV
ncbi:MAG: glycine/sarcosine/betaine reductase selenoprotein B family protein [Betaproteobacteria bacterium]